MDWEKLGVTRGVLGGIVALAKDALSGVKALASGFGALRENYRYKRWLAGKRAELRHLIRAHMEAMIQYRREPRRGDTR